MDNGLFGEATSEEAIVADAANRGSRVSFTEATEEFIGDVTNGDVSGAMEYITLHLVPQLFLAAIGLAVIFLGYLVASYLSRIISKPVRRRVDETLGIFVGRIVFYCIMFGVVGAVLSKMGAPLGGLAAMLAAAGFAIGLAFQGTLSNFAAGVLMLVFRPFKVGDFVNAAGVMGKVNEIDLFTTTLDTPDNRRIIVPNSSISGGTIENISHHHHRRVEVPVGVAYAADIDATRAALTAAVMKFESEIIPGESRGHAVIMSNLGASSVDWLVRMWVPSKEFFRLKEALTVEVKRHLDANEISIPFPQLDVHLSRADGAEEAVFQRPRVRPLRRAVDGHAMPHAS
ncbi:small-conductance mechanosensitive channel [Rhodopirellula maiorica SM1]|uniref:Small-conductance mechanosensitive channel n=1 Tax=Rhodopirellula maiorica SM1 TaxID=1265738 RepID=M5RQE4_9BACT|nr:mechanosensitive ion channel domain-containing protein [Rhodopirellula maiorica]EMI21426.1 small-conductance mechanosensitive channel [Rhodopirellula maiorica SM1]